MGKETPQNSQPATKLPKLPRLAKGQKIQKRPLLHPAIAAPRTSSATPKVIYVKASSPFIAMVKRTQKYLTEVEKRSTGSVSLTNNGAGRGGGDRDAMRVIEDGVKKAREQREQVWLKGTGKAIEKTMQLGLWFQTQERGVKYEVSWKTGSVGAVDDVVDEEGSLVEDESRIRRTSTLEVGILER
ncbi:hypothetical protein PVAG01_08933 [Phlyctema vagabunda]|uniref:Uncharacterized protein n=1 Tax=Phlyctema vagabunda TaxID=108571 RepID=A0ABR4PAW9_9HELO